MFVATFFVSPWTFAHTEFSPKGFHVGTLCHAVIKKVWRSHSGQRFQGNYDVQRERERGKEVKRRKKGMQEIASHEYSETDTQRRDDPEEEKGKG